MVINFSQPIKALNGETYKVEDGSNMSLSAVCIESLLGTIKGETQTAEEKLKYWILAKKLYDGGEIEVSIDDLKIIKDRAGKFLVTGVYGNVVDLLESNT